MSILTPTDFRHGWEIFGHLGSKALGRESLAGFPASKTFPNFFVHVLIYQLKTWYIHLVGSATYEVRVSSQSGQFNPLYSQKWIKINFLHLRPQKLYRAFRFCMHTYLASVLTRTDFRHGCAIFCPLQSFLSAESFLSCFLHVLCFEIWTWNLIYRPNRWHDRSSLIFIAIRSIWHLQPKISQIRFSTHGLINYMNPSSWARTLIKWVFWPPLIFVTVWQFLARWPKTLRSVNHSLDLIGSPPLESFPDFFLNVLMYQLESWSINLVGCTTYWVHVSPQRGPCDLLHVLSQAQLTKRHAMMLATGHIILGSLWPLLLAILFGCKVNTKFRVRHFSFSASNEPLHCLTQSHFAFSTEILSGYG